MLVGLCRVNKSLLSILWLFNDPLRPHMRAGRNTRWDFTPRYAAVLVFRKDQFAGVCGEHVAG